MALIKKFRLGFHDVEVLSDIYQSPQPTKYVTCWINTKSCKKKQQLQESNIYVVMYCFHHLQPEGSICVKNLVWGIH